MEVEEWVLLVLECFFRESWRLRRARARRSEAVVVAVLEVEAGGRRMRMKGVWEAVICRKGKGREREGGTISLSFFLSLVPLPSIRVDIV